MEKDTVIVLEGKDGEKISGMRSAINGYTREKVDHAKKWLNDNRIVRLISFEDLIKEYNYLKGTNVEAKGCKACTMNKYYMGIQNYAYMGEKTLRIIEENQTESVEEPLTEEPLVQALETVEDNTQPKKNKRGRKPKK